MHDIDLTKNHFGAGNDEFETDGYDELEFEFGQESEMFSDSEQSPFSESEEMEMAADLLEVSTDEELEQFLGDLFKKIGRGAKRFFKSSAGRALGGILKKVAKTALPIIGRAAGTAAGDFVAPGLGSTLGGSFGGSLASSTGQAFGLELEGMSPEDQEFEVARQYVKLAGSAAQKVAQMPSNIDPRSAATAAITEAAKQYAPGLLKQKGSSQTRNRVNSKQGRSGRWVRQGNKIILFGV